MQYIEKFIISKNLSVIIHHDEDKEMKTILIEKQVDGKLKRPYEGTFNQRIRIKLNREYLVFFDKDYTLQDMNLKVIALTTGEEIKEKKMEIYQEVSKVNKYSAFEIRCFPKR